MLCGQDGSINLDEFLEEAIRGPASFECDSSRKGDECHFSEPEMNNMIKDVFGDPMIYLKCDSGECLHKTQVPGYTRPIKKINKPLIAGVIAGVSLLVVAAALGIYYYSRKVNRQAGLGPIHLDEDDEGSKLMTDHQPAALQFENISYNVNGKQILTNIIGSVKPGEVMAIMGPSGAGKTSFLDILARKNKRGTVAGDVYVNGVRVSDNDFRDVIGFVDQDDTMMPTLTVYETILNSALLRLPKDMALSAKKRRVMDVITQLGIYHIRDSLIGSEEGERGISGGEKRRVSIACELVTSPSILFLDEPTSGLDSFNAYNVIESLVNLAKSYKRTVIFTIHQPRSNIVALFDELVLLARGRVVYSGAYAKCQQYFADLGYACPPGFNIADYLVDLTMHAAKTHGDTSASESTSLTDGEGGASDAYARPTVITRSRTEPPKRPNRKRSDSIRALQERQLFTRRVAPAQEELPLLDDSIVWRSERSSLRDEATAEWERHRNSFEEPDNSPPAAPNSQAGETDLDLLIKAYDVSILHENIHADIVTAVANASGSGPDSDDSEALQPISPMKGFKKVGWIGQFSILSGRTWKNLYRNPMLMLTHYAIAIVLAGKKLNSLQCCMLTFSSSLRIPLLRHY
jgi:ABC-type multidrug transport system ATPase subunit